MSRRFQRYSVVLSVVCGRQGDRLADQVVNLSLGGACVQSPSPLAPGSRHSFSITVPDAKLRPKVCEVEAQVVWASESAMGLVFDRKSQCVDDYLRRLERSTQSL